jgi:putative transposase
MVRFRFKRGLRFLQKGLIWALQRRTATGKLVFEEENGEAPSMTLTESEVHENYLKQDWLVDEASLGPGSDLRYLATPRDLRSLPEEERNVACERLDYLTELHRSIEAAGETFRCAPRVLREHIAMVAAARNDVDPPGWSTVWNWWKKYRTTRCPTKLADRRRTGRRRDAVQFSIFEEVLAEVFLNKQRNPGKAVVDAVSDRVRRMNAGQQPSAQIIPPSRATIYRWLNGLYHAVVLKAREGKAISDREMRGTMKGLHVERILERYEIDHTPVDVLVVCQYTRMVLGRPYLTLVIDRKSRMIAGFYLSFHAPSAYSVLYALRMAILPKEDVLKSVVGLRNPWPARGIPRLIATDNGMDLHSHALEVLCQDAAIELLYCGVADPEMKGAIERLFGTLSRDLFHTLPGTVFSSIDKRGDYPSEECAALDLETLTKVLIKWIVDKYHCTPHRGLHGRTPLQAWQDDELSASIELPAYPRQLDIMVGHSADRTVFQYGVEYHCVRYNSNELLAFREPGKKAPIVEVRAYEHDISFVDVLDERLGEFIRVPAVDQTYTTGLNRHVHLLIRQEVNRRFGNDWQYQQLLEVKVEIQTMVADALKAHKAGKRKAAAAQSMIDSEQALEQRAAALSAARQPLAPGDNQLLASLTTPASVLPSFASESRPGR